MSYCMVTYKILESKSNVTVVTGSIIVCGNDCVFFQKRSRGLKNERPNSETMRALDLVYDF